MQEEQGVLELQLPRKEMQLRFPQMTEWPLDVRKRIRRYASFDEIMKNPALRSIALWYRADGIGP